MIRSFWKQLKSGTDIRGVASEGIESQEIILTNDVIRKISMGFAVFLSEYYKKKFSELSVCVGHDSRISSERIRGCVISSLLDMGINIIDTGLSSTPAMFMTTIDLDCDGAIEITASHHPFNKNGLKFFSKNSGLDGNDIDVILKLAQEDAFVRLNERGIYKKVNYMSQYSNHLKEMVKREVNSHDYEHPLSGLKVVVDAGNGVGGFYAFSVLEPLGVDISGSQFLEPDGFFRNHIPNPEDSDAMKSIKERVIKEKADLGIIFDTDVDRCGGVDKNGKEINRNRLIALSSLIALENNHGGTIVTDSVTSTGLTTYIEKNLKGVHHRFKRGYRNVINEAKRLNALGINSPLAIETSGHAAFRENYFLDDGAYLITKIIIRLAKLKEKSDSDIALLLSELKEPKESIEKRILILEEDFVNYGNKIILEFKSCIKKRLSWKLDKKNMEGLRVSLNDKDFKGWFLLRMSVHDPVMALNVESDVVGGSKRILDQVISSLKQYEGLDL